MASDTPTLAGTTPTLPPILLEWLKSNLASEFEMVLGYIKSSPDDPESDPYKSLYAAREHLTIINDRLINCPTDIKDSVGYKMLFAHLKLQLGLNYIQTEETGRGQECFEHIVEEFCDDPLASYPLLDSLNQLGILWANRAEHDQALDTLLRAKALHSDCKKYPSPLCPEDVFKGHIREEGQREKDFENLHTHTLFYLAQVYAQLDQPKVSAEFCQNTLSRQLETNSYDPIEWSLNAATISQYYIGVNNFAQARHCLASAHVVLSRIELGTSALKDKVDQVRADFSRCWIKYCVVLLKTSIESINGDGGEGESVNETLHKFNPLEVSQCEEEVTCDLVEDCVAAKKVFLFGQKHVEDSKEYFTLDSLASDHTSVLQDYSQLYKLLSHFEPDLSVKCRMHKRRIDILTGVVSELNPQHFLPFVRQLEFEMGETYRDMADLKIVITGEDSSLPGTTGHAVKKINTLLNSSMTHFQKFVDTFEGDVDTAHTRSYLLGMLNIGRLHTKKIYISVEDEINGIKRSLNVYRTIVGLKAKLGEEEIGKVFEEEMKICEEMVELLPLKLTKLQQ